MLASVLIVRGAYGTCSPRHAAQAARNPKKTHMNTLSKTVIEKQIKI